MVDDQRLFQASSLAREELQSLYKQLREAQNGTSELRQYHDNKVKHLKAEQVSMHCDQTKAALASIDDSRVGYD